MPETVHRAGFSTGLAGDHCRGPCRGWHSGWLLRPGPAPGGLREQRGPSSTSTCLTEAHAEAGVTSTTPEWPPMRTGERLRQKYWTDLRLAPLGAAPRLGSRGNHLRQQDCQPVVYASGRPGSGDHARAPGWMRDVRSLSVYADCRGAWPRLEAADPVAKLGGRPHPPWSLPRLGSRSFRVLFVAPEGSPGWRWQSTRRDANRRGYVRRRLSYGRREPGVPGILRPGRSVSRSGARLRRPPAAGGLQSLVPPLREFPAHRARLPPQSHRGRPRARRCGASAGVRCRARRMLTSRS